MNTIKNTANKLAGLAGLGIYSIYYFTFGMWREQG